MIAIDLSKQKALDVDPGEIQQIKFAGYLTQDVNTTMIFIIEEPKQTILIFTRNCESIVNLFCFNIISIKNDSI